MHIEHVHEGVMPMILSDTKIISMCVKACESACGREEPEINEMRRDVVVVRHKACERAPHLITTVAERHRRNRTCRCEPLWASGK